MLFVSGLAAQAQGMSEEACAIIPANIEVSRPLRGAIERALHRSETLRRQCAIIGRSASVRVVIVAVRALVGCRARATIRRHEFGALHAAIEIPVPGDYAELLAHELEHVIEQMEGLNLPALARRGAPGIQEVAIGAFETQRARETGRAAAREMQAPVVPTTRATPVKSAVAMPGPPAGGRQSVP